MTDLVEGWRYREYLAARRDARLAQWVSVMVWAKKAPSLDDLTGVWDNGEIMDKMEQYRRTVKRIRERKKKDN